MRKFYYFFTLILLIHTNVSGQLKWYSTFNDYHLFEGTTHAFDICETPNGLKQIRVYRTSDNKWKFNILMADEEGKFTVQKTHEIKYVFEDSWAIQDDFVLNGIYNIRYDFWNRDKVGFELTFEDPNPEGLACKYWTYYFDEDGVTLGINFGKEGKITGDYILHESCQPYDITQRLFVVLKSTAIATNAKMLSRNSKNIKVFPNPTSGVVHLKGDQTSISQREIQVYDHMGRLVKSVNSDDEIIDLSNYNDGMYVIRVGNETIKVIKK